MKIFINTIGLLFISLSLFGQHNVVEPKTYITGKLQQGFKHDTLYLVMHGQFYEDMPEKGSIATYTALPDKEGCFSFTVPTEHLPSHISLFLSSKRDSNFNLLTDISSIKNFIIEPKDSIHIDFDKTGLMFSGRNASLFKAQYAIVQIDPDGSKKDSGHTDAFYLNPYQWLKQWDYILNIQLESLAKYRANLSPLAYSILRADILGANRYRIYHVANFYDMFFGKQGPQYAELNNFLRELEAKPAYIKYIDPSALSPVYVEYLYKKMVVEIKYNRAIGKNAGEKYDYFSDIITKYPDGLLRDKLLVCWIKSMAGFNIMQPRFLDSALKAVKTPIYAKMLNDIKHTFSEGAEVTDYNFKDANDRTIRLADFKGKVLMIDMWFSGCGPCVDVAKGMPEVEGAFKNRKDIEFISISTDKDKNKWLKSIDGDTTGKDYTHFTTKSTIYLNTAGTGTQNAFIKKYALVGFPTLLIIDKKGRVYSSTPSRPTSKQSKAELIAQLNEALSVEN